jgi:large subunit ribosomal protein L21
MYAVIASGGKQEKVAPGEQVRVELLDGEEGSDVTLRPVMIVDGTTVLSTPDELAKATVTGKIVGRATGPKINGFTYKAKTTNRRRYGHRQKYHMVEITSITAS